MTFCQACGLRGNKEDHYPAGPYSAHSRGNSGTVPPPHRTWLVARLLPHALSPRPNTHKQTWTQSCKITTLITPHRLSQGTPVLCQVAEGKFCPRPKHRATLGGYRVTDEWRPANSKAKSR